MSVQAALELLRAIGRSPDLQEALEGVTSGEELARVAGEAGFAVRPEEITQAFGLECAFRLLAHPVPSSEPGAGEGGPSC